MTTSVNSRAEDEGIELCVGETIIIAGGPLEGLEGSLLESAGQRAIVSVRLLDRSLLAEIDGDWIKPAARQAVVSAISIRPPEREPLARTDAAR